MQNDPPPNLAGKSAAYDYLKSAPDSVWAWEFARRNALVRAALSTSPPAQMSSDEVQVVHGSSRACRSPVLWASSSDDNAANATVIWNADIVPHVLRAVAVPTCYSFGGVVLDLADIALPKTLFIGTDGRQSLVIRGGMHSLQLAIEGAPITDTVALFVDTKVPKRHAERQLRLLECFRVLRAAGALPGHCFPPHPRCARNAFVLEALDGYLAGKSHRDIAVDLFGEARVDRDWSDAGENLRDVIRRAVARGISTMEGGYLDFFR
ncbi:MAG: DUF2285 domain-containing protein [Alphaproteobacteria bacterium]|nr:DUF2285 domain-containing protein [Alphaproteobacteria bacterium]